MIRLFRYGEVDNRDIFARTMPETNVTQVVSEIIENVRKKGDSALYEYAEKFDKARLRSLEVSPEEIDEAFENADKEFVRILEEAAENIRRFHERQVRNGFILTDKEGVVVGQKVVPVDRAGLYVPGGTAAYPSSVLMNAIPAKIAGVKEIEMTTPPNREGKIDPAILVAARVAGVDKIYKIGGAQAIAALAYGTQSVKKADKIVGPGNAFVAEAKKQVFGAVSIDMIAGPSEIMVIADGTCNPVYVAADLLSQAEHDKMASAVLVTDSESLAYAVQAEVERQLPALSREAIARASVEKNGKIILVPDIPTAIDVANEIAPEHLELCVDNPFDYLGSIRHAGSVFLGKYCPEPLGDYLAGTNHTLPTGGTAKFSSPLSVDDFVKKTQFTYYTKDALGAVADDVAYFAKKEGLTAHAASALVRKETEEAGK